MMNYVANIRAEGSEGHSHITLKARGHLFNFKKTYMHINCCGDSTPLFSTLVPRVLREGQRVPTIRKLQCALHCMLCVNSL